MKILLVGAEVSHVEQQMDGQTRESLFAILRTRLKWRSMSVSASNSSYNLFISRNQVFAHSTATTGTKTFFKFSGCCASNC